MDHALPLVRLSATADTTTLGAMLGQAGLPIGGPVVVLVGGADGLTAQDADACESAFALSLVPVLEEMSAVLVDGGTRSGVMRLAGRVRCGWVREPRTSGWWPSVRSDERTKPPKERGKPAATRTPAIWIRTTATSSRYPVIAGVTRVAGSAMWPLR